MEKWRRLLTNLKFQRVNDFKGPPSTDMHFDRLFLLWKFTVLIAALTGFS